MKAFDLIKMTLGEFVAQPQALCIKATDGDTWLAPDVVATRRLAAQGVPHERIWTVMEMLQTTAARTVVGLIALTGITYGDVFAEALE